MDGLKGAPGAYVELGRIAEKNGRTYRVESYTREGVFTRFIYAANEYVREYEGEPAQEAKYSYGVGDRVYFFVFPDGNGLIIGKA